MNEGGHFQVGCEVIVLRDNRILLGMRQNCYGAGTWALPGGHCEFLERTDEAVTRELSEELDLVVSPSSLRLVSITDDPQPKFSRHYLHVTFELPLERDAVLKLMEPDKCSEWRFFSIDQVPVKPFFPPHEPILRNYLSGRMYSPRSDTYQRAER